MTGRRALPARHEFRFGTREIVIFAGVLLLLWGLTFALGVLVGREARPAGSARQATALGGEAVPDRAPPPATAVAAGGEERLTFYQTLTAPTPVTSGASQPVVEERIVPKESPAPRDTGAPRAIRAPERPGARAPGPPAPDEPAGATVSAPPAASRGKSPAVPGAASAARPAAERQLWTVQVSSFRVRAAAEELRARLSARGFDAYLISLSSEEGRVRYRVRVGGFTTRGEAERVAAELRNERNLNPFVTIRAR